MNIFENFLGLKSKRARSKNYLGIDIGTVAIKAVEMSLLADKPNVVNYGIIESSGYLDRANGMIQTSSLSVVNSDAPEMLKALLVQMGTKTKDVVATIPSFTAFTSVVDLPVMNITETAQAIPYQARSLVPLPMSDVTIDWTPIGQFEDQGGVKKQRVFLVSVPNEQINAHKLIFKKVGLNLTMLEVEEMSLARALTYNLAEDALIIDVGAFTSTIAIAGGGTLKYSSQTDFASSSLTQALAKGLGVSVRRAEALKRQRGLAGMAGEYGISTLMMPFIDVILSEGQKAKKIFEEGGGKVSKLILAGGGGGMQAFTGYAGKQLGLPAELANPWRVVSYPPQFAPLFQSISSQFSVAVGAGMKPFIK
jgi:type IV pilus assembly protein PilM